MKILLAAHAFLPEYGGLEQQLYMLAKEFQKLGHQVEVLTEKTHPEYLSKEVIDGISIHRMPHFSQRNAASYLELFFHLLAFAIIKANSYDLIIIRGALTFYPLVFGFFKTIHLVQTITWVTADTGGDQDEIILLKQWPAHSLLVYFCKGHTYLNSICEKNYQHYQVLGFPQHKLTRILNGVDTSSYSQWQYPSKVRKFLYFAKLIKKKGFIELLQAFYLFHKKYPEAELFIGGDGDEVAYCKDFIRRHKLAAVVHYQGVISRNNLNDFYKQGDCLVLPSYSEGFSLTLAEAVVRKKVIVATDVSDLKQHLGNMVVYCEKRSALSLYFALVQAYHSHPRTLLNYTSFVKKVNIHNIAQQILAVTT